MKRSLRDFRTLAGTAAAALCLIVGAACSTAPVSEPEADQLFEQAEEEIQNDHLLLATEHLKTLRNKFPYSKFAPLAQLRLGGVCGLEVEAAVQRGDGDVRAVVDLDVHSFVVPFVPVRGRHMPAIIMARARSA